MTDWLQHLSDDQKALVGCAVALFLCGTLMSLSYYVGRLLRRAEHAPEPKEPYTVRMPDPARPHSKGTPQPVPVYASADTSRRAA